jgi:hypothetical protein
MAIEDQGVALSINARAIREKRCAKQPYTLFISRWTGKWKDGCGQRPRAYPRRHFLMDDTQKMNEDQ